MMSFIVKSSVIVLFSMVAFVSASTGTGDATFFTPGLGACGHFNTPDDMIVAVATATFAGFPGAGANPNANPICGKKLVANAGGKSVAVTVVDECAGCPGGQDIDLSPAAFQKLADLGVGRLHSVTWTIS